MKSKNILAIFVLLTVASLLVSCSPPTPQAANFYMTLDSQGANRTATYAPTDPFYVFFDVAHIQVGTNFEARWYALNVAGIDASKPFQTEDLAYSAGNTTLFFHLANKNNNPWPVGQYRVDIYMAGNQVGQVSFNVAQ